MKTRATVLFGLLTVLCISAVFFNSLFRGASISRFDLIRNLDVLYDPGLQGTMISVAQDPSACLQSIPKEIFLHNSFSTGQSPIWNPLSGCGQPLIADPSNTLWNPIDLIFSPSDQRLYNAGIVIKIILGGLLSYLYFLRSGASPWAACTAALGYSLSARVLRGVELATNFEMLPAVFLIFRCLRYNATWKQICLAALGLFICYVSLHPEVFFVAILSAVVLWFFEFSSIRSPWERRLPAGIEDDENRSKPAGSRHSREGVFTLCKLTLMTAGMVAPFLFPFIEYLKYAHSYKYGGTSLEFIPLAQMPFMLEVPKLDGTLFPGWVLLLGLPLGFLSVWKKSKSLLAVLFFWLLFVCRPAAMENALAQPPYSFLLPEYALGTILLIICYTAAIGLTELNQISRKPIAYRIGVGVFVILFALTPLICVSKGGYPSVSQISISFKMVAWAFAALGSSALLILSFPLVLANSGGQSKLLSWVTVAIMGGLPLINLCTLIAPVKAELPTTNRVMLPPPGRSELISVLKKFPNARVTACGDNLLPPNTGLLYGLADLRTCSPLNNIRYFKFMNMLGAHLGYCNMMNVPFTLNHLIDLASVEILVSAIPLQSLPSQPLPLQPASSRPASSQPVSSQPVSSPPASAHHEPVHGFKPVSGRILPGMRIVDSSGRYSANSAELEVQTTIRLHANLANRYMVQLVLRDERNHDLWRSILQSLPSPQLNDLSHNTSLSWRVPAPVKQSGTVKLFLLVHDSWTRDWIKPDGSSLKCEAAEMGIELSEVSLKSIGEISSSDGRFSLLYETPDLLRVYRNNQALPRAYLVHKAIQANSDDQALQKISSPGFNPLNEAVLESSDGEILFNQKSESNHPRSDDQVQISRIGNTEVEVTCKTQSPAILVLTDLYYPGWQVEVDRKPARIFRANYLFCGTRINGGTHTVSFRYSPWTFNLGLICGITAACLIALSFVNLGAARKFSAELLIVNSQ